MNCVHDCYPYKVNHLSSAKSAVVEPLRLIMSNSVDELIRIKIEAKFATIKFCPDLLLTDKLTGLYDYSLIAHVKTQID